jgi:CRP-like cAMP-binding protein
MVDSIFKFINKAELDFDTVVPGAVIGEIAFVDREVRSASGISVGSTVVIAVTRMDFDDVFTKLRSKNEK